MEIDIQELDLSVLAYNCIRSAGFRAVGELREYSPDDLANIPFGSYKFSRRVIRRIKDALARFGLSLRNPKDGNPIRWSADLSEGDWDAILGLPWSLRMRTLLEELKKRNNEPLRDSYIVTLPRLRNFNHENMEAFNDRFREAGLPYLLRFPRQYASRVRLYVRVKGS